VVQLWLLGDFTFMKIQRILGILWFAVFSYILVLWLWQFMEKTIPYSVYFRVLACPVFVFGALASIFLFRGARWARFTIGNIALFILGLMIVEISESFLSRPDGWLGLFALASFVLLFCPRHEPVV
jgi:peptidoglycan/LPS O-acetylase OafA/YrhL